MIKKLLLKLINADHLLKDAMNEEVNRLEVLHAGEKQRIKNHYDKLIREINRDHEKDMAEERKHLENLFATRYLEVVEEKTELRKSVQELMKFWKNMYGAGIRFETLLQEFAEIDKIRIERNNMREIENHQEFLKMSSKVQNMVLNMKKTNPKIEKAAGRALQEQIFIGEYLNGQESKTETPKITEERKEKKDIEVSK